MKYALITLFLVMGSITCAAFYIEAENTNLAMGQETTISLYSDSGQQDTLLLIIDWGFMSILKDPIAYPPLGSSGQIIPYTQAGFTDSGYQITISGTEVLPGGLLADFTFVTMDIGDIGVSLYDETNLTLLDSLTLAESPEPATVMLLGLGGLLMRRKIFS